MAPPSRRSHLSVEIGVWPRFHSTGKGLPILMHVERATVCAQMGSACPTRKLWASGHIPCPDIPTYHAHDRAVRDPALLLSWAT